MSFSGHVYNRGLHCRLRIPPVYTTHHTRKQRQGDLSLFSRFYGDIKTDKAFVLCPFYLFNFEQQPFCWFELRPSI